MGAGNTVTPNSVRLIPDVSAAALRSGEYRELALWYCLRVLNHSGNGQIDQEEAFIRLKKEFRYTWSTLRAHYSLGESKFWDTVAHYDVITGQRRAFIHLRGVERVSRYLNISRFVQCHFHIAQVSDFMTGMDRVAQIYSSTLSPGELHSNPISRAAIQEYTGINKLRQIRLQKRARVKKIYNPGLVRTKEGFKPLKVEVYGKTKVWVINKRLPNSYRTPQAAGARGMLKAVSMAIRATSGLGETDEARTEPLTKRYFTGEAKAFKALSNRGKGLHKAYFKVPRSQRLIPGRREWAVTEVIT
jgi:hypothetical protein